MCDLVVADAVVDATPDTEAEAAADAVLERVETLKAALIVVVMGAIVEIPDIAA